MYSIVLRSKIRSRETHTLIHAYIHRHMSDASLPRRFASRKPSTHSFSLSEIFNETNDRNHSFEKIFDFEQISDLFIYLLRSSDHFLVLLGLN